MRYEVKIVDNKQTNKETEKCPKHTRRERNERNTYTQKLSLSNRLREKSNQNDQNYLFWFSPFLTIQLFIVVLYRAGFGRIHVRAFPSGILDSQPLKYFASFTK